MNPQGYAFNKKKVQVNYFTKYFNHYREISLTPSVSGYNRVLCGSGVPGWTILTPDQFRRSYLAGSLHTFHAVFSYSSVEHSGLGRYGDTLNPWGDLMAVAEAWCVAGPGARLALAVPQTGAQIFSAPQLGTSIGSPDTIITAVILST